MMMVRVGAIGAVATPPLPPHAASAAPRQTLVTIPAENFMPYSPIQK